MRASRRASPRGLRWTRHRCLPALNWLARRCCSCGQAEVEPRPRWGSRGSSAGAFSCCSSRNLAPGLSKPGRGDSMAKAAGGGSGADSSVADELRRLGVKGVLVQMAERGQLLALKCEMPQCYHHKGRGAFDQVTTPRTKWAPSPDHYPILKSAGGHLVPENVRLSHVWCNNRAYGWRTQIRTLLRNRKSRAEIAEILNSKGVPPAHGTNRWTAAMVRKAYVS